MANKLTTAQLPAVPDTPEDRIFDGLSERFHRKIYRNDDPRGVIRLHIVQDDLQGLLSEAQQPLHVLDAGAGMGQMSVWLAQQGHSVVLAEPSGDMLAIARRQISDDNISNIKVRQCTIQALAENMAHPTDNRDVVRFDLIICHAVLEWLAQPQQTLLQLMTLLKPRGSLSLMFFNQYSKEMRHLIGGDFAPILEQRIASDGYNGLAPISPLPPDTVSAWLHDAGFSIDVWSGVRCFYDYSHPEVRKRMKLDDVLTLERCYSQREPWRSLARYQHMVCRRT